ncbi:tripartite tricarboxylate transporter substrate binding protein [Citricoccus sp. I39-566]|uniref:Bug family tripartite tricarboxylate transporter substrate binding protein n=1 Tax=Citricoccus sp. I39-566 TaxID=3073268 RepID=UPI00286CD93E|nr:tripartite tricarboxylate transporter substrate binding protein [Citricoccus sp. I39-566]WMY78555.1 tripartite tricarboxylate transporter substrate binding protein [Citricoccus sp. I39-566]
MKNRNRILSVFAVAALALTGCSGGGEYPDGNVEIIVPNAAGGSVDTTTRAFAEAMSEELDTQFVVVNRDGGGQTVGTTEAANANPDGYTTYTAPASAFASRPLLEEVQYSADDFISIAALAHQPYVIVTDIDSGYKTLEDLAAADERVTYTTFGRGNMTHLAMGNTLDSMGVEGEPVPYESGADAIQAVTSGQVDIGVVDVNIASGQIDSGTVNALAVTSEERHESYPDVVSLAETEWPEGAGFISMVAWAVPADTPEDVVNTLTEAAQNAYNSDSYQEYVESNYLMEPEYNGTAWFEELIPELSERSAESFERLGLASE